MRRRRYPIDWYQKSLNDFFLFIQNRCNLREFYYILFYYILYNSISKLCKISGKNFKQTEVCHICEQINENLHLFQLYVIYIKMDFWLYFLPTDWRTGRVLTSIVEATGFKSRSGWKFAIAIRDPWNEEAIPYRAISLIPSMHCIRICYDTEWWLKFRYNCVGIWFLLKGILWYPFVRWPH